MSAARRSIGGGCADSRESVWEEMDVSGENEGGAMLLCRIQSGVANGEGLICLREVLRCDKKLFGGACSPRFQVGHALVFFSINGIEVISIITISMCQNSIEFISLCIRYFHDTMVRRSIGQIRGISYGLTLFLKHSNK
jgi:hypothetical protein